MAVRCQSTKMFVMKIPHGVSENEFSNFLTDRKVDFEKAEFKDNHKQQPVGEAYVYFKNDQLANEFHASRHNLKCKGANLYVDFTGNQSQFGRKLFLTRLPKNTTEDQLRALEWFKKAEKITVYELNESKKFGQASIEFASSEDADAVFDKRFEVVVGGQKVIADYVGMRKTLITGYKNKMAKQPN